MNKNCIVIFIKYPETGKVKTRLAENIGIDKACDLYKCFVLDLINTLNLARINFKIAYHNTKPKENFINWLGAEYEYFEQHGNDLGEKMKNAFINCFNKDFENVLIIGSDSPDLNIDIFQEAFNNLSEKNGAVIGPAFDGGYYLIGFNKGCFLPEIFTGIKWSTPDVYKKTLDIFNKYNQPVYPLPEWLDIDTIDDLKLLVEKNQKTDFYNSNTMKYIPENISDFNNNSCL